ncbi:MAG: hypothetical protein RL033_303 [Pseudomonadota bacterium]
MFNRSRWSWPLIPLAVLHACSSPVDGSPFDGSGNTASGAGGSGSNASNQPATTSTSVTPSTTTAPGNASLGNEQVGALPVATGTGGTGGASSAAAGGAGGTGGTAAVTPPVVAQPVVTPPVASTLDPLECASYETGFLPLVHQPVCSSCHTNGGGLPRFEPFAQAQNRCAQIGREVASGDMPPNGRLSADQLAVVASWVSLGCPETAEDAAPLCASSTEPTNPNVNPPPPPAQGGDDDDDDDDDGDDDDDDGDDDDRGGDDGDDD